jgi:hypothetical protein
VYGGLTASPLPHHWTYGSRVRRFGRLSQGGKAHPNRSIISRRASREFIPAAEHRSPPRRMPSRRSTTGNDSLPPFRPSARSRVPTLPSADFCGAVREDGSPLSPCQDTPQISRGQLSYLPCIGARLIKHSPFVDGLFTHKERLGYAAGAALLTQVSPVAWQHINLCGRSSPRGQNALTYQRSLRPWHRLQSRRTSHAKSWNIPLWGVGQKTPERADGP